ncbi:MAG TPA: ACT domain-containing protein [Proteobacteria bacterium]|nr:ACT domain-containing protein [Deltaproteobacteria bacterium]HDS16327.1 ACT domain-containing protein [Pseudomonadota bacterium]
MDYNNNQADKDLAVVLVVGRDRSGIVAQISDFLWKEEINIEDISQKIMQGIFVMAMLVDLANARSDLGVLAPKIEKLGDKIGLSIQIQHQRIFTAMHRV